MIKSSKGGATFTLLTQGMQLNLAGIPAFYSPLHLFPSVQRDYHSTNITPAERHRLLLPPRVPSSSIVVCTSQYIINMLHIIFHSVSPQRGTELCSTTSTLVWLTRCPGTSLSQSQARNSSIHHYKLLAPLRCQFDKNSP